jgi:flagellar basal-body rod modification protein FlgD
MTIAATVSGIQGQTGGQNPYGNAMENLSMDEFLKMMIAELQNQDPLEPMDNTQILQQIGQIREITSNDKLTDTLDAAFLGQNLATANNLMGQWLVAMSDDNSQVLAAGQVSQVSIENGIPRLHVGNKTLDLDDISQIQSVQDAEALTEAMEMVNKTNTLLLAKK